MKVPAFSSICLDIKKHGVADIFIACHDYLNGMDDGGAELGNFL